jgi:hypothetical protein
VLDGGVPPDPEAFLALVYEVGRRAGRRARALRLRPRPRPTFAAALLVVRGLAPDVASALVMMRAARAVVAPTRVDRAFLSRVEPRLRAPVHAVDLESPVG